MRTGKTELPVDLRAVGDLTPEERHAIQVLSAEVYPPAATETWPGRALEWAPRQWSVVIRDDAGQALAHVGAVLREGLADGLPVLIGGIGGVMTHPAARRQGLAARAIERAIAHFEAHGADFALLVCEPRLVPMYQRGGWRPFEGEVFVIQRGEHVKFTFNLPMTRAIRSAEVPEATIDLLGNPW